MIASYTSCIVLRDSVAYFPMPSMPLASSPLQFLPTCDNMYPWWFIKNSVYSPCGGKGFFHHFISHLCHHTMARTFWIYIHKIKCIQSVRDHSVSNIILILGDYRLLWSESVGISVQRLYIWKIKNGEVVNEEICIKPVTPVWRLLSNEIKTLKHRVKTSVISGEQCTPIFF